MGLGPHFHTISYFTIPQSLKGEQSFVGAPASLYNLTTSAPDPLAITVNIAGLSKLIHTSTRKNLIVTNLDQC